MYAFQRNILGGNQECGLAMFRFKFHFSHLFLERNCRVPELQNVFGALATKPLTLEVL